MDRMNDPIDLQRFPLRDTPPILPEYLHLAVLVGTSGSGKTTKFLRMCKLYNQWGCYDKVRLFAKSCNKDPKYKLLYHNWEDPRTKKRHPDSMEKAWDVKMTPEFNMKILRNLVDETEGDIQEYEKDQDYIPIWQKWSRNNGDNPRNLSGLNESEISELRSRRFMKPKWFKFPSTWVIFDDFLGSRIIYPSRNDGPLVNLTIRSRHDSMAIMHILHGTQDTLTPTVKSNVKYIFLNQESSNDTKKAVARGFCKGLNEEDFVKLWDHATRDPYDYFYCNLKKREFYKNFETRLSIESDDSD